MHDRIVPRLPLLLAAVFLASALPAFPQATVDPQSLVGEWEGTWETENDSGKVISGSYTLTIERIEGAKVYGRGEIRGHRNTEFPLEGTLAGNRLRFDKGGKDGMTELVVDGRRMLGASRGNVTREIALSKRK